MDPREAGTRIAAQVTITREDIARAKSFIMQASNSQTNSLAHEWLNGQKHELRDTIDIDASDSPEVLTALAKAFGARMSFYMAVWELVTAGELIPSHTVSEWKPELTYRTSRGSGGIPVPRVKCYFLPEFFRPPVISGVPSDPDIFLQGIDCKTLHPGIREAIEQALACFRRGLYMPAIAMLAAATEAAWTECGIAVAKKLASTKLAKIANDPFASISKLVMETRKALELSDGKALLEVAGQHISKVTDAEMWTTTLRERRNALHWSKARSFVADHSETGTLLMGAPLYIGTLEAIRAAC